MALLSVTSWAASVIRTGRFSPPYSVLQAVLAKVDTVENLTCLSNSSESLAIAAHYSPEPPHADSASNQPPPLSQSPKREGASRPAQRT